MFSQLHKVAKQVNNVIIGKELQIRQALACLLAGGHLLIEDLPGVGKTTLAHALAISLGLKFNRLQFTSDLLPADVIGVSIFDREKINLFFTPARYSPRSCWPMKLTAPHQKHSLPCSKQWKSIRSQPKARHANCLPHFS
jgi:MoxR-like ATPase